MATKSVTIPEREQVNNLCDELDSIIGVTRQEARKLANKSKWMLGEAIVDSPLYKKFSKGQSRLVELIASYFGYSDQTVYLWIRFYEAFPSGKCDFETPWRKIVAELTDGKEEKKEVVQACRHCPKHCPTK